jgi:hypothetical protein
VVVVHVVLVAIVVVLDICLAIMGWVDIDLAVESMCRGVGGIQMSDERFFVRHDGGVLKSKIRVQVLRDLPADWQQCL